ncbi:MAG: Crp/Fnr family transcriptional regulator [Firmicutes bacterium]|nr:Crp/Fnr family transcriptional regulator [Bacillota bacterium]
MDEPELLHLVQCFQLNLQTYKKEMFLLRQGDCPKGIGFVVEGSVYVIRDDSLGNREILAKVGPGDFFAEVYGILGRNTKRVAVIAASDCQAVFLPTEKLITPCHKGCDFHGKLIRNMLQVLAEKNLFLTEKMVHLTRKTIREKLISYLDAERDKQKSKEVILPFNRQQLADYLSVERSALSRELSKMQQEGLISFHKNRFVLKAET